MCPDCHHELAPKDLVPVFSWLWLRGKCRYCHKSISWQYPVVELLVALLFVLSYLCWPLGFGAVGVFSFVLWLIFLTAFVALGVYDLRWFILPDRIIYPLIGLALIEVIVRATIFSGGWQLVITAFWGIFFLAGLFCSLYVLSKGAWIGFGDVKLAIVLGLLVGGPLMALALIFLASVFGSLVAIPLLINGRAKATTQIPFGPFLLVSTIIIVLSGTSFSNWFNNLFYLH
jgi:prepilin signal peptidase PulO-like enzyme (type II secretory pathway)